MSGRMPVLRHDDVIGAANEIVDQRHDLVPVGNRQRSTRAEIILQIDDDKRFVSHGAS
jgi:hypothetical protein